MIFPSNLKTLYFVVSSLLVVASATLPQAPPGVRFIGYANLVPNAVSFRPIAVPEGTRVNGNFLGGNWTDPSGRLTANIIGGIGGENGDADKNSLFHLDVRYTIQFVSDQKFGFVQLKGLGKLGGPSTTTVTVETDSTANQGVTGRLIYASSDFVGTPPVIVSALWTFI